MRTWSALAVALLVYVNGVSAETRALPTRKTRVSLKPGEAITYQVTLKAYEFLGFHIEPKDLALELTIKDPAGELFRYLPAFVKGEDVTLANDVPGAYTFTFKATDKVSGLKGGQFEIDRVRLLTARERLNPPPLPGQTPPVSGFIAQLRERLKKDKATALAEFWKEMKLRESPLIEPLAGDERRRLVTFVYRGDRDVRNVFVSMWPFTLTRPSDYRMVNLAGTDVWFKSIPMMADSRVKYSLVVNVPTSRENGADDIYFGAERFDPLNTKTRSTDPYVAHTSRFLKESILELPAAPQQPWTVRDAAVPAGEVKVFTLPSEGLKANVPFSVYTPAGYADLKTKPSLFIVFDRTEYTSFVPTPTILDNLIAKKKIPPTLAVLIDFNYPLNDVRSAWLTCNPAFSKFLKAELLPWLEKSYRVKTDAKSIVIGGSSFGGLASTCAGLHHPETFQNILSQSGSYWWTKEFGHADPKAPLDPDRELNDVVKMVIAKPKLPLRFYMDAGAYEIDTDGKEFDLLLSSRHLRDVLLAKGYDVKWQQFRGGHDYLSWRGTLSDGLIYLLSR